MSIDTIKARLAAATPFPKVHADHCQRAPRWGAVNQCISCTCGLAERRAAYRVLTRHAPTDLAALVKVAEAAIALRDHMGAQLSGADTSPIGEMIQTSLRIGAALGTALDELDDLP